jgi:hypothetical protein
LKRGSAAEGQAEQPCKKRQIIGRERVAARAEEIERLAVAEEDGRLVLLHYQLRSHLDIGSALLRETMNYLVPRIIEILYHFDGHVLSLILKPQRHKEHKEI